MTRKTKQKTSVADVRRHLLLCLFLTDHKNNAANMERYDTYLNSKNHLKILHTQVSKSFH